MNESITEPPDHELLRRIRNRDADSNTAERAFNLFFARHREYVFDQIGYAKRKLNAKGIDEADFCIGVFRKVWDSGSRTYSVDRANGTVEERLSVRAWLGTIAKNLLREELRDRHKVCEPGREFERRTEDAADDAAVRQGINAVELVQTVGAVLSERDAKVVWFKIEAYDPATGNAEPDSDAVLTFCNENEITPGYLRKIYSRSIKSLQSAMSVAVPINQE